MPVDNSSCCDNSNLLPPQTVQPTYDGFWIDANAYTTLIDFNNNGTI